MYNIRSWEAKAWAPEQRSQSLTPERLSFLKARDLPNYRRSPKRTYRQTQQTIAMVNSTCRYDPETYQGRSQLEKVNKRQKRNHQNELADQLTGGDGMQRKQSTRRLPSTAGLVKTYASVAAVIPKNPGALGHPDSLPQQGFRSPKNATPSRKALKRKLPPYTDKQNGKDANQMQRIPFQRRGKKRAKKAHKQPESQNSGAEKRKNSTHTRIKASKRAQKCISMAAQVAKKRKGNWKPL